MNAEIILVTKSDGDVRPPLRLNDDKRHALMEWMPPTEPLDGKMMESAAYWRNIYRAAEPYGPRMIAMLMESGALEPEQDPEQALRNVLKDAGF